MIILTLHDFKGIIAIPTYLVLKSKDVKNVMEDFAQYYKEIYVKTYSTCANKKGMELEKRNIELKKITYYFIQLFFQTGKKYSCTQTKLGKLISIVALYYARNNVQLFDEKISKYKPNCGTLIEALAFIPKSIYSRDIFEQDNDKNDVISEKMLSGKKSEQYSVDEDEIPEDVRNQIRDVFINFGAYCGGALAKCLNPIVDEIISDDGETLDLSKVQKLSLNNFAGNKESREVIEYLLNS